MEVKPEILEHIAYIGSLPAVTKQAWSGADRMAARRAYELSIKMSTDDKVVSAVRHYVEKERKETVDFSFSHPEADAIIEAIKAKLK